MKRKLSAIAVAAALAYAGSTFASSNDATVTQTGNDNSAVVAQDPFGGSASASVNQNGDGNTANVTQTGDGFNMSATVSSTGNANSATVLQDGTNNASASVSQTGNGNSATVNQQPAGGRFSNEAIASVTQAGTSNTAVINQVGTNCAACSGNGVSATILQVDNTSDSFAQIDQIGPALRTSALIDQDTAFTSDARITQTGDDQNASVVQNFVSRGHALINQQGARNTANISQTNAVNRSSATILQNGNDNVASHSAAFNSNDNTSFIQQTGNANNASVVQGKVPMVPGDPSSATWNEAHITQNGSAHVATIGQFGLGTSSNPNQATITQTGFGNNAAITQNGGAGNSAVVTQN